MASPNLCTVSGNVRNLLGQGIQNVTVTVSVVTPFIYPATGSLIAGQLGSVTTTATGDFSLPVVETQTAGTQVKFTFTYYDGVSTNRSKSYTVVVPNQGAVNFSTLLSLNTAIVLPTYPALNVSVIPENGIVSTNAQAALEELYADQALKAPIASPTFTGTVTAPTFVGALTGNASGSAASFTGALAGDVTGTQSATAIAATTVTGKNLTGFSSAAGTVTAADTILTAVNKLDGNTALKAPIASPTFTGTATAPTFVGALTGNVTGNASGSAASFTGALAGDITGTQSATAISAATVTGKAITGFVSGAGTVAATDTILAAVNKLDGNTALKAPLASPTFTGTVTAPAFSGPLTGNVTGNASGSAASFTGTLVGDVGGTQGATAIGTNVVTNAQRVQMATKTLKGNNTGATANEADLTVAQVNAILPVFTSTLNGLAPLSGGGTTTYLRADGTWATVTAASFTDSQSIALGYTGFGSTNTKIRTFVTPTTTGTDITYTASATLGDSFTINTSGVYAISYGEEGSSGSPVFGISVNSANLTTDVNSLPNTERRQICAVGTGNDRKVLSWTGRLTAADVVRAHTNNAASNFVNSTVMTFTIVRVH